MIYGIGTDIADTRRFLPWVLHDAIIKRFFNKNELYSGQVDRHTDAACQHYAVRFAAKEAFTKALGIGLFSFALRDIWIEKDESGKPYLQLSPKVRQRVGVICCKKNERVQIHVSLSHEKEYAIAFVVIETIEQEMGDSYVS